MPPKNPWVLPDGFDENVKKALAEIQAAFKRAKKAIPQEALEALRMGNWQAFLAIIDREDLSSNFLGLETILRSTAQNAAVSLYQKAGVGAKLTFDLIDEYSVNFASTRTGMLIKDISEEMRLTIQRTITEATLGDITWQTAAEQIAEYIPLTQRDAAAVRKYHDRMLKKYIDRKGWNEKSARKYAKTLADKYAQKLTDSRARTIARTEIANAATEGQYIGWESGVQTGMIDSESTKEWIAEPNACEYCAAIDGQTVRWDEEFPILGGKMMPPAHPNCRCATALLPPDYGISELQNTPFTLQAVQKSKGWWNQFEIEFAKHLAGKHDQSSHGHGNSAALKMPEGVGLISESHLANKFPFVGLSDKAQKVRSKIALDGTDEQTDAVGRRMSVSHARYTTDSGQTVYLEHTQVFEEDGTTIKGSVSAIIDDEGTFPLAEIQIGNLEHGSLANRFIQEADQKDFFYNRIASIKVESNYQRQGIATAMLEFARMTSPNPVFHSGQKTNFGDAFSAATKSALAKAIIDYQAAEKLAKHLAGKHDQSTHASNKTTSGQSKNLEVISRMSDTYDKTIISKQLMGKKMDADGIDWKPTMRVDGVELTAKCDYQTKSGSTIRLELLNETDGAKFSYTKVVAHDLTTGTQDIGFFESISDRWAANPLAQQSVLVVAVEEKSRRQGIATAMLEFARRETGVINHGITVSEEGEAFSIAAKSAFTKAESYKPTEGMVAAAKRALRWKEEGKATGAGTPVGWGRATDIAAGRSMSLSIVKRMYSFFSRHEVDKKGKDFDNLSNPSNGRIMWDAWGGDAGFTWSKAIVERAKKLEKHLQGKHDQSTHASGKGAANNLATVSLPKPNYAINDKTIYRGMVLTDEWENKDFSIDDLAARITQDKNKGYGTWWSSEPDVAILNSIGDEGSNYRWGFGSGPDKPVYGVVIEAKLKDKSQPISTDLEIFTYSSESVKQPPNPKFYERDIESFTAYFYRRDAKGVASFVGQKSLPVENYDPDALSKHLQGQHDQSTHGRGGHSTDRPYELKSRRNDPDYFGGEAWTGDASKAQGPNSYLIAQYAESYGGKVKPQFMYEIAVRAKIEQGEDKASVRENLLKEIANDPDYPRIPQEIFDQIDDRPMYGRSDEYKAMQKWAEIDPEAATAYMARENAFVESKLRAIAFPNGQTVGEITDGVAQSLLDQMQEIALGNNVSLTMSSGRLKKFIEEDHYRTAFETTLSGKGASRQVYLDARDEFEFNKMGIPTNTKDSERPIYGVIGRSSGEKTYGDTQVIFKDDVKHRTTATIGDSLDAGHVGVHWLQDYADGKVSIDDLFETHGRMFMGILGNNNRSGSTFEWHNEKNRPVAEWGAIKGYSGKADIREIAEYGYIETQIHGGLKLSDVATIVIPSPTSIPKATQAMLADKGIEVIVGSPIEKSSHA